MADVSVEFGASDTGLAQTLKNIQSELATLDAQQKTTAMSAEEFQKSLSKIKQLEGLETKIQKMATATTDAGTAASAASPKVDELGNSANNAGNKAENSAGMFDASFTKIAAAFTVGNLAAKGFEAIIDGVFSAGRAIIDGFGQALDLGGRLSELSARTGETAGSLLVLETAFKNAGLSGDQVGTVINKLQNFMQDAANGGDKQKAAMDNLGVSLSELAGKTPTQQMGVFAAKIAAISDPTARAAAASEVFGDKLGGKLLPLLTEFSPSLTDAEGKVGSLASVMDEHAGTFDAFGESVDAAKGKFSAFSAGIMSGMIPALQGLGTEIEDVDAADLGREIGDVLNPALEKMSGIIIGVLREYKEFAKATQAAAMGNHELANSTGPATGAFDLLKTVIISIAGPMGDLISGTDTYIAAANKAAEAAKNGATAIDQVAVAAAAAKPQLDALPGSGAALNLEFENLPKTIEPAISLMGDFKTGLDAAATSATPISESLGTVKTDFSEISSLSAQLPAQNDAFTQSILATNTELNLQPGIYADIFQKISETQAQEEARRLAMEQSGIELQKSVQNQIALNNAIAAGNTKEQERLQNLIAGEKQQQRINTLVLEYAKSMPLEAAKDLAKEMVKSETAVKGMKANMGQVEIKTQTVNGLLAQMNQQEIDAPAQTLIQRLDAAQTKLSGMKQFVGVDMQNMPLESIIDKLGLDDYGLTTTESKLKLVEAAVTKLGDANPADLTPTVDEIGVNNELETVKGYLAEVTPPDATPTLDQTDVQNAATDAKDTLETELASVATVVTPTVDDTAKQAVRSDLEAAATDVPMTVKADQAQIDSAIGALQAEITNNFTGGEGGQGGQGGNGGEGGKGGDANADVTSITAILDPWTEIITAIRDRLPMTALA